MVVLCNAVKKGVKFKCLVLEGGCNGKCCTGSGTIYIFADDIIALSKFLGEDIDIFLERHVKVEQAPTLNHDKPEMIPILSINEVGELCACEFLDERGLCKVHPARPFQCMGYPFWNMFTKSKEGWEKLAAFCPGARQSPPIPGAEVFKGKQIKDLVKKEKEIDDEWEDAMVSYKGDYKAYLHDCLKKKEISPLKREK